MLSILKKKKTNRPLVYVLLFAILALTVFTLYKLPKSAKAGIDISGNDMRISAGIYAIDDDGKIYKEPSNYSLRESRIDGNLYNVDREYYAYLFEDTGKTVSSSTNLTVESGATVMMEGTQELAGLTVRGKVNQPYPDREGKINKPIYTNKHWLGRLTGYIKIEPNSRYYLSSQGVTNYSSIEIGSGDRINDSTSWTTVYRYADVATSGWDSVNYGGLATYQSAYNADPTKYKQLENTTSAAKYVPIRYTFGSANGGAAADLYYRRFVAGTWANASGENTQYVKRSNLCGIKTGGSDAGAVDMTGASGTCGKPGQVNFDYYVSKAEDNIKLDLSNAVRSAGKVDLNLLSDFKDGNGDFWGDSDPTTYSDRMRFQWSFGQTPLGQTSSGTHSAKRAPRYSAYLFNAKAYDGARRIPAGLTLRVSGETLIEGDGAINLEGEGYPGYTGEMSSTGASGAPDANDPIYNGRTRGGSANFNGTPGGGYSNASGCAGSTGNGGSHAGQGGYNSSSSNNCRVELRADAYDNEYDPSQMGSGAGASGAGKKSIISGSGGGLLKLTTRNLTLKAENSINVNGSSGEMVDWLNNAGGAGGTANITVNGAVNIAVSKNAITAKGASGFASAYGRQTEQYVGGGGGYILLNYANSSLNQSELTNRMSVAGANGTTQGAADLDDGTDGKIRFGTASVSTEVLTVTKVTYKDDEREATFEAGDNVTVELRVYDPGNSDRDDFKIEDAIPLTTGTVNIMLKKSDGSTVTKNLAVNGGKITLEGDIGQGIVLKPGENIITYTYTL